MKKASYKISTTRESIIVGNKNPEIEIVDEKLEKEEKEKQLYYRLYEKFIKSMKNNGYLTDKFNYKSFDTKLYLNTHCLINGANLSKISNDLYQDLILCNGFLEYLTISKILNEYRERMIE